MIASRSPEPPALLFPAEVLSHSDGGGVTGFGSKAGSGFMKWAFSSGGQGSAHWGRIVF